MTREFKTGDRLVVKNVPAEERNKQPSFIPPMVELIGREVTVLFDATIPGGQRVLICQADGQKASYAFLPEWLDLPAETYKKAMGILGEMLDETLALIHGCDENDVVPEMSDLSQEVLAYWEERSEVIWARQDKLREQALAKLTGEERRALGVWHE